MSKISVLYVRVSTDEQAREGYSIESQIDRLSAYAKFQGWTNVEVFVDEGESAKNMERPAMKRLIQLIKKGRVAVVATLAVDRLSRNLLDMLQFVELCEQNKTAYVCAALNFDTSTPIGRMVLQILAAFAEFERAMIATRVKTTMMDVARKKKRYQSVPPYGYQFDDNGNLVIVPDEAEWIRRMADMFVCGQGFRAITRALNEAGVTTKRGGQWNYSTVRRVVTNEIYTGQLVYNRRYYDKAGKMKWRDPSEWIVQDDAHPPIFSPEQWERVQARAERSKPTGNRRTRKHRLSGLITCGHCGSAMYSRKYGPQDTEAQNREVFVCKEYQSNGGCWFNWVANEDAEAAVYATLERLAEGQLTVGTEQLNAAARAHEAELARREASIDQRMQRQIAAYENGLISDRDLRLARDRIEKERELLAQDRARADAADKQMVIETIEREAKRLLWLWNNGDMPTVQTAIRGLIESIVVKDRAIADIQLSGELFNTE